MIAKGILVVVSGFSGAGKGTLMKALLEKYPGRYALSISATTRGPREGEVNGQEYFFLTRAEFEGMVERDELVEYACYVENYYGTPKKYVMEQMEAGRDVLLEIEMQGALKVKQKFPDTILIFVTPPDVKELESRLRGRKTETEDIIQKRLLWAKEEAEYMDHYDYILVNDDLADCVEKLHHLIQVQHCKASEQEVLISEMKEGLKHYQGDA